MKLISKIVFIINPGDVLEIMFEEQKVNVIILHSIILLTMLTKTFINVDRVGVGGGISDGDAIVLICNSEDKFNFKFPKMSNHNNIIIDI